MKFIKWIYNTIGFDACFIITWSLIVCTYIAIDSKLSERTTIYITRYYSIAKNENEVKGKLRMHYKINPFLHSTIENEKYVIPCGIYEIKNTYSPKFHTTLPVICNVPKRAGIRIHIGYSADNSKGCILTDRHTLNKIMDFIEFNANNGRKTYICISSI